MKYILIVLLSSCLFATISPIAQKEIELRMMRTNIQLQKDSPIVLQASVINKEEISPTNTNKGAYYKKVRLVVKVQNILENKNKIEIGKNINLEYLVYMHNRMPGPMKFNIQIPSLHKSYIFYLDDYLQLSAKNFSIDSLNSELKDWAKKEIMQDIPKSITVRFDHQLTPQVKKDIKEFLFSHKPSRSQYIKISAYGNKKNTDEYVHALTTYKAKYVKNFLVEELGYKEKDIHSVAYGQNKPICFDLNEHEFEKPCLEVNERVTLTILKKFTLRE